MLIEREVKESSTEDLVVERDQVKLKKSSLRRDNSWKQELSFVGEKYGKKNDLYFCRRNFIIHIRGKDFKIKSKMEKYIADYKKAKKDLSKPINQMLVKYSTLQYFEKEIGL